MKERICAEARQLFNQYGVKTVRLDDITRQLGISKKTLYLYFQNKEDLVQQMLESQLNDSLHEATVIQGQSANAIEGALLIWDHLIRYKHTVNPSLLLDIERHYATAWHLFQVARSAYISTILEANLRAGISEGLYRSDLNNTVLAWLWIEQSQSDVPAKGDEQVVKHHFVRGLLTQKGLAVYEAL
ncbi:TetR/AcrR family transcriptional regulator [Fibrivirga algicola]|uniref:TetR/AcrR family transcriptional regulator n=1 Tax=Fibrivirga algicola TaxID=2950420 RepID=A0ABX0QPR1_9BACT|nr:TetR/AcrR family transcriptional regulator [Fibrivirga algicola]ARK12700.1 TetR family transcriptional regulator [Fibrella sp. ES10-3-2-2]NID12134.1 TetR/AcrR family transcriptional regulator [Fibrivirga algicola]